MAGKGQPPKSPEDKRRDRAIKFSPNEEKMVNAAREKENPEKRFGTYVREITVQHAKKILDNQ